LNHLPVTDWIWMQRLTSEGDAPDRLDAILFETFPPTCARRVRRRTGGSSIMPELDLLIFPRLSAKPAA
jgi:uncharacterized damage-inducible protein DinB